MRKHLSSRAPRTIHTSAQESIIAKAWEVLTHVIGRISARDGALALSGASAVVRLGARANAFIAFKRKITTRSWPWGRNWMADWSGEGLAWRDVNHLHQHATGRRTMFRPSIFTDLVWHEWLWSQKKNALRWWVQKHRWHGEIYSWS